MNTSPSRTIADKLDRLFTNMRAQGPGEGSTTRERGERSYHAVSEAIMEQQGVSVSHTYLWQLRTGKRDNPTITHLAALARYFGVPTAYFLDDSETDKISEELQLLAVLRDAKVADIALRIADLSPGSRQAVSDMIQKLLELEHRANP